MKIKVLLISKMERNIEALRSKIEDEEIIILGDSVGGAQALDKNRKHISRHNYYDFGCRRHRRAEFGRKNYTPQTKNICYSGC